MAAACALFSLQALADCTAGAQGSGVAKRFVLQKGEVHDRQTGLIWKRCSAGWFEYLSDRCDGHDSKSKALLTWEEALRAAKAAGPGWRLPTKPELESLIAGRCRNPAIDEALFPDTRSEWFWTSTVAEDGGVWQLFFGDGHADHFDRDASPSALRLVRAAR
jgi:hypothetical protein